MVLQWYKSALNIRMSATIWLASLCWGCQIWRRARQRERWMVKRARAWAQPPARGWGGGRAWRAPKDKAEAGEVPEGPRCSLGGSWGHRRLLGDPPKQQREIPDGRVIEALGPRPPAGPGPGPPLTVSPPILWKIISHGQPRTFRWKNEATYSTYEYLEAWSVEKVRGHTYSMYLESCCVRCCFAGSGNGKRTRSRLSCSPPGWLASAGAESQVSHFLHLYISTTLALIIPVCFSSTSSADFETKFWSDVPLGSGCALVPTFNCSQDKYAFSDLVGQLL